MSTLVVTETTKPGSWVKSQGVSGTRQERRNGQVLEKIESVRSRILFIEKRDQRRRRLKDVKTTNRNVQL